MTHPAADPYHSVRTPTAYVGRLAALERVGRSLNATLDMDQNLDQIVREAVANTSATQASVLVTTQPAGRLHLYACCGYTTEEQRALAARAQQGQSLADRVLATGQVQASGENQDLPSAPARLAVPIRYGEQIVGVLDLQDETEGVFDDGSRQFASVLAEQAAVAIGSSWRYTEQVRREAAARRRLAQLGDLIAISHVLHTGQELDELLDQVVQAIPDTGGFNVVLLSLVESGNGVLRRVAAAGIPLADFRALQEVKQPLSAFERLLQPQYRISASYLIPHQEAQAWEQVLDVYVSLSESLPPGPGQWHPRDMLLVPLHDSKGELLGLLSVDDPQDGRVPGRAEIEILELFAGQAALAIESARLYNELELRVQQRTEELATALRRQASEANKTRAILESISDAVIVCDVQGEVILANPATTRVLDLPVEVLLGRRLDACTSFAGLLPSQAAMAGAILEAARAARRSLERGQALVHTVFQAAGRTIDAGFSIVERAVGSSAPEPGMPPAGQMDAMVAVFRDVTHEAELSRMKSELVSMAAHDLRAPMVAIMGYADLLLKQVLGPITDPQQEIIHSMRSSAERLTAMVNNLLDISRIESEGLALNVQRVSMAHVVSNAVSALRESIAAKGQQLKIDVSLDLPRVIADGGRMVQVITNLLSNAHKYSPHDAEIVIRGWQEERTLRLAVQDAGIGIAPEDQKRLFTRFFRAENAAATKERGTGLGLAICREIVTAHRGEILVDSELGRGSTFTVVLPLEGVELKA